MSHVDIRDNESDHYIRGSESGNEINARHRDRNKENAKKTRDRKKALVSTLEESIKMLYDQAAGDEMETCTHLYEAAAQVQFQY